MLVHDHLLVQSFLHAFILPWWSVFHVWGAEVRIVIDYDPSAEMTQAGLVSPLHHLWTPHPLFFPLFPPRKMFHLLTFWLQARLENSLSLLISCLCSGFGANLTPQTAFFLWSYHPRTGLSSQAFTWMVSHWMSQPGFTKKMKAVSYELQYTSLFLYTLSMFFFLNKKMKQDVIWFTQQLLHKYFGHVSNFHFDSLNYTLAQFSILPSSKDAYPQPTIIPNKPFSFFKLKNLIEV